MKANYVYAHLGFVKNGCFLGPLKNVEDFDSIRDTKRRRARFPKNAFFPMQPPVKRKVVCDFMQSGVGMVVSEKARELLAKANIPRVEFLPVNIANHKGKLLDAMFYIVHLTEHADVIDSKKSKYEWHPAGKKWGFIDLRKIVLDEKKTEGRDYIRPKHYPMVHLFSRSLRASIEASGLEGASFIELNTPGEMM